MSKAPLWKLYPDLEDLARRTGYRISYLERCKKGNALPRDGFRRRISAALGRSEEELFEPREPLAAIPHDAMQELADTTNARVARKNERVRAKFTALQGGQP